MPKFSDRSLRQLATCHPDLQRLLNEAIKFVDFTILEGHRPKDMQDHYYHQGKSKVAWPNSKHNVWPSHAVDVAPYPIDWNDHKRFYLFVGFLKGLAQGMNIELRVGADWSGDFDIKDQSFHDLPHIELKNPKQ